MAKKYPSDSDLYQYHYNREERLSKNPNLPENPGKTGWLKGNKGLVIVLIEILVLVLVFALVYPFFARKKGEIEYEGYSFSLKALRFGNDVLVSVKILASAEEAKSSSDLVFCDVLMQAGNVSLKERWPLPVPGREVIFRAVIEAPGPAKTLKAQIILGEKELFITCPIQEE